MTRLYVHAPIPSPGLWLISGDAEPPPGHLTLAAAVLTLRQRSAKPATDLARPSAGVATDRDAARAQFDELLALFVRMDREQRARLLAYAQQLLEAGPA